MNAIKNKIRSQRGASITFALLLFLVCAVLSSVIIVAATTAAGRMSGLKDMDTRYNAIADAGHQLCEIFDGQSVTVEYKSDKSVPTKPEGDAILVDASVAVVTGKPITHTVDSLKIGTDDDGCTCSLSETLNGGQLEFTIGAEGGKLTTGTYLLRLTFTPNVKKVASTTSTDTATSTVTWKLRDIRKIRATNP